MVFKTRLSLAHSHTVSAAKYPWWTLVENLQDYLASVNHIGRVIKLPADAVEKYGFKQVEKPDPSRLIDKWVSPRKDIPLAECDLDHGQTTLNEQMQSGLQIFYLKRGTGKDFLDKRPRGGIGDKFLEQCLRDGTIGSASIDEVAKVR